MDATRNKLFAEKMAVLRIRKRLMNDPKAGWIRVSVFHFKNFLHRYSVEDEPAYTLDKTMAASL
jgi:hypothetical protein